MVEESINDYNFEFYPNPKKTGNFFVFFLEKRISVRLAVVRTKFHEIQYVDCDCILMYESSNKLHPVHTFFPLFSLRSASNSNGEIKYCCNATKHLSLTFRS